MSLHGEVGSRSAVAAATSGAVKLGVAVVPPVIATVGPPSCVQA